MIDEHAVALEAVHRCAENLRKGRRSLQVWSKTSASGRNELVTNLDVALNSIAATCIRSVFPADLVVGEEDNSFAYRRRERYWLVDPIDGTRSFVEGRAGAAISIALVHGGKPVVSVVHDIGAGTTFSFEEDVAPKENDAVMDRGHTTMALLWNPYQSVQLRDSIIAACSLSGFHEVESLALRAIAMAKGKGCLFLSLRNNSKLWDSAPAAPFLRWCGATFTDLDGRDMTYLLPSVVNTEGAISTRALNHDLTLKTILPILE